MPWVKGQSGNPSGRPKAVAFAAVLAQGLAEVKAGKTTRQRIAAVVLEKALKGDLDAIKWIVDRVDGRSPERLEVDATVRHPAAEETIDAVLAGYAARGRVRAGET
jgi:nitrogen fixation protein FixH